jgi:lipoprotein NlpD
MALRRGVVALCAGLFLSACGTSGTLAPVSHGGQQTSKTSTTGSANTHRVSKGETLYSIAFQYGQDYHALARQNGIISPYTIFEGQKLRLTPHEKPVLKPIRSEKAKKSRKKTRISHKNSNSTSKKRQNTPEKSKFTPSNTVLNWRWPSRGEITKTYLASDPTRKGINISGRIGQPVLAASGGKIVYSGSGLLGYGRLIIIKHNERFLSAYAHNRKLLVKEGAQVKQGQQVAEMGQSGTDSVNLHFEIRRDGKPVDPLHYLPKR